MAIGALFIGKTNADFTYADRDGWNFVNILRNSRTEAEVNNIIVPPDFIAEVERLKKRGADTTPIVNNYPQLSQEFNKTKFHRYLNT